jgi:uncharacterized protein (TIGR00251 family)
LALSENRTAEAGLRCDETADGTRFRVRAVPGARRSAVLGVHGDALRVAVRAVAENGRANEALIEVLATALGVRAGQVEIVAGGRSRGKSVRVRGLAPATVRARLLTTAGRDADPGPGGARR